MRIRKSAQYLAYLATQPPIAPPICVLNQSPWDLSSSSPLSADQQINQGIDRFSGDVTLRNSPRDPKRSTEPPPNQSTDEKVAKPRVHRRKRQEVNANANAGDDGIYDFYEGFGPNWSKRRGPAQNCKEAAGVTKFDRNADKDDDDDEEKPLKERSMKSLLEADRALC